MEKENGVADGQKVKILRFDDEGEYKSDLFLQLCRDEGFERHFTVRETPQQNGSGKEVGPYLAVEDTIFIVKHWAKKVILS